MSYWATLNDVLNVALTLLVAMSYWATLNDVLRVNLSLLVVVTRRLQHQLVNIWLCGALAELVREGQPSQNDQITVSIFGAS